MFSVDLIHYN